MILIKSNFIDNYLASTGDPLKSLHDGVLKIITKKVLFTGLFVLHRTLPDYVMVAMQGFEPRTLRI